MTPNEKINYRWGPWIALLVTAMWITCLWIGLHTRVRWQSPWTYLLILVQTQLYTGLFITAHDSMHGTASLNKRLNDTIGYITAALFAFNWYPRLKKKHFLHHNEVATEADPDYHRGSFVAWYFSFLVNYITLYQFILMAAMFNILAVWIPQPNIILFWMLPAIFSTLQLFYFGTYRPHRGEHAPDNPHKSTTLPSNHVWAFLSCYFFGYHYEHHDKPHVPWWQLWKQKRL